MANNTKNNFSSSPEGDVIRKKLEDMVKDRTYNTQPGFTSDAETYPDNVIPFVEKHLKYLDAHKGVDPDHYLSNLRLMTRNR
jgi:hypothetical protein